MQHLDDGRIAEFVDDALTPEARAEVERHLADCAECRDRTDDAVRVRDRAAAVLARTGPADLHAPPFDLIAARAKRATRPASRAYLRPLAWAATVVLAAGVGWYARDVALRPAVPTARGPEPRASVTATPEPARLAEPETRALAMRDSAVPTQDAPALGAASEPALREQPPQAGGRGRAADEPLGEAVDNQVGAVPPTDVRTAADQRDAAALAPKADAGEPAPQTVMARRVAAPARAEGEDQAWRAVDLEEAERLLGHPVLRVEGLTTAGHAVRSEPDGYAVRTTQRLGDAELEIIQRGEMAGLAAADGDSTMARLERRAGQTGVGTLTMRREGQLVTLRAPVSLDSLRMLLGRLVP